MASRGLVVRNRRRPLRPGHRLAAPPRRAARAGRAASGSGSGSTGRLDTGGSSDGRLLVGHGRRFGRGVVRNRVQDRDRMLVVGGRQLTGQRVARVELAQPLDGVVDAPLLASLEQGLHRPLRRLGRPLPVSQRLADVADPLQGVRVLRVGHEELLDVVERLLVQAVLQVDVGLGEDPVDRALCRPAPATGATTGGRVTWGGAPRVSGGRGGDGAGRGGVRPGRRGGRGARRPPRRGAPGGRRRRAPAARRGQLLARLGVVREELQHHAPGERRLLAAPPLGVDAGQGAVDGDGLGHLPEVAERLRHEAQRVHVLLVGAVADLELAEGLLGVAPGQVLLGQLRASFRSSGVSAKMRSASLTYSSPRLFSFRWAAARR